MDSDDDKQKFRTSVHENQPYDEAVDAGDTEDVASLYEPTPRHPTHRRSRGDTPPDSRMSDQLDEDEFDAGAPRGGLMQQQQALYGEQQSKPMMNPEEDDDDEDEDDDSEEDDDDSDDVVQGGPSQTQKRPPPPSHEKPMYSSGGGDRAAGHSQGEESGTGSEDEDDDDSDGNANPMEGAYDPAEYEHLPVTPEIKELFQYITRYTPQTIDLDHKLRPFIPDFIPAVGDIDAFIKIPRPDGKPDTLGLTVLDEPCAKQSDPTVLDLQLRAISKQPTVKSVAVKSIVEADKNPKAIENWIESITELHRVKPAHNVHYTKNMPDVDSLMQEWPADFEEMLKEVGLPTADLDCDLSSYIDIICALLDIPVYKSKIQSLHLLFTLFSEFKNSQHFKGLADKNQLDNTLKAGDTDYPDDSDRLVL